MSEITLDLTEARFDFSVDSLVRDTLLTSLLARQKNADSSRKPVSLEEIEGDTRSTKSILGGATQPTRELPSKDKGPSL